MKLRDSRHGRNAIATQLRQLLTISSVNIYEAVHVSYAESMD